jgi:hypothetical protein
MSRQIALKLTHQAQELIALPALVRTLDALQKVLLQIGAMYAERDAQHQAARPSAGRFSNAIHAACELRVVGLSSGSAEALLELPSPPPVLFAAEPDLGFAALETTRALTAELTNGANWERVHELLPADAYRDLILRSYRDFCPTATDRTEVALWDPEAATVYRLQADVRTHVQVLRAQASPADVLQERQFVGLINVLQANPPRSTLVLPDGRSLPFPYDEDLAEELRRTWDERVIVRAICRVVPKEDGEDYLAEIKDVSEIILADESPLELNAIPLPGNPLPLLEPLSVVPDFSDDLVSFEYNPLGIVAYGATREAAERAFLEELAWLWEEYAHAPDEALARDAQRLKQRLHELVEGGHA